MESLSSSLATTVESKSVLREIRILRTEGQYQHDIDQEFGHEEVPPELLVRPSEITSCERIGSGNFGVVYKALLTRNASTQYVAVKTLRGASFGARFNQLSSLQS